MSSPPEIRSEGKGHNIAVVPARRPVRVTIYNQPYTLVTSADPADVEALAHIVDELVSDIAVKAGNVDTTRAAVLACLHLADKVRTLEKDLAGLRLKYASEHRKFTDLLDQAIETRP